MSFTTEQLPLQPPADNCKAPPIFPGIHIGPVLGIEETRAGRRARRTVALPIVAILAVAAAVAMWGGWSTSALPSAPTTVAARPVVVGRPQWPRRQAPGPDTEEAAWQPTMTQFTDGSSAALYPDRVRSPWGRPVAIVVERFDTAGKPMTGILDMELIITTPGQQPSKGGFTEQVAHPGTYQAFVRGNELGIGRSDFQLIASQSGRPADPISMTSSTVAIEIVGGVRFAGPLTARWLDDHLLVDVPISSRTSGHVMVRGELRTRDAVLAEVTGEADVVEGDGIVTLDAGNLIAIDDPRVATLALLDGTAAITDAGEKRWTDFWRGPRTVVSR